MRSAPSLLAATSKLVLVLVESSKKRLNIVLPSKILIFLIFLLLKVIYFLDSSKMCSISFLVKSAVSTK